MNKQFKLIDGVKVNKKIEWCDYTWNPIAGCFHGCEWNMPDGQTANCYAEDVAEGIAASQYPEGFEYHYWHPNRLGEPFTVSLPSKIFVGSMADVFGHWVPEKQIELLMSQCAASPVHTFQFLTKNPVRIKTLIEAGLVIPKNCWIGASLPPDKMWGKSLSENQKRAMFARTLKTLAALPGDFIRWLSIEPLSWDAAPILEPHVTGIQWIVIGAASTGSTYHQPEQAWIERLHDLADRHHIPVFHKGNLTYTPHREDFPK